jgi:hypothetical protein
VSELGYGTGIAEPAVGDTAGAGDIAERGDTSGTGHEWNPGAPAAEDGLPPRQEVSDAAWSDSPEWDEAGLASEYEGDLGAIEAEDQLPPRQDVNDRIWSDSPGWHDEADLGTEYDGDLGALVAEDRLPSRPDARAATWDDTVGPDNRAPGSPSDDPASQHDGDLETQLAVEEHLPESRPRQDAAADIWGDDSGGQDGKLDADAGRTSPSASDAVTESRRKDEGENGPPDLYERQVAVHAEDGTEVPITVEYLPPEARTVGDTTPVGIGRKPTGEELFDMENDDPAESSLDRLLKKAVEEGPDVKDAFGNTSESIHDFNLPGPASSGHAHEGHVAHEPAVPADSPFSDVVGSTALAAVAVAIGVRHLIRQLGKGEIR